MLWNRYSGFTRKGIDTVNVLPSFANLTVNIDMTTHTLDKLINDIKAQSQYPSRYYWNRLELGAVVFKNYLIFIFRNTYSCILYLQMNHGMQTIRMIRTKTRTVHCLLFVNFIAFPVRLSKIRYKGIMMPFYYFRNLCRILSITTSSAPSR